MLRAGVGLRLQAAVSRRPAAILGLCAAVTFAGMAAYRLDRPGLYYDELHQAAGSFAYVGRPTPMFSRQPIWGVPVLNMPYSGAVKTAIYGGYLKVSGWGFSILSWRWLGILSSAAGIAAFCLLVAGRIRVGPLALFLCLLLTDINLLLLSRHDWGPVALAFLLRMAFIGVWLRHAERSEPGQTFTLLGLIVGIAIFEKLSSLVMLGPLALLVAIEPAPGRAAATAPALAGLSIGAFPVVAVNAVSLVAGTQLPGLSITSPQGYGLAQHLWQYLTVGNGVLERLFILGTVAHPWAAGVEGIAIAGSLLLVGAAAVRHAGSIASLQWAAVGLVAYLCIGVTLHWLPAATAENHWIIGTPFHYLAMALGAEAIWTKRLGSPLSRTMLAVCLVAVIGARIPPLLSTFEAARADRYSPNWDPTVNAAASYVANLPEGAVFIAADWGVATQVFCLSDGRQDFVFEPYWNYEGRQSLAPILDPSTRTLAVVGTRRPHSGVRAEATERILHDMAADPNWRQVPLEPWLQDLPTIELRAYRRISGAGSPATP